MALLDYSKRLRSLQLRKYSRELNESALSPSFDHPDIPEHVKYMIESMRPIDKKYNDLALQAAEYVKNHLERKLKLYFNPDYRIHGSVVCDTNIHLESEVGLLIIIDHDSSLAQNTTPIKTGEESGPRIDIGQLRDQVISIMKSEYDEVDVRSNLISIYNKNLRRHVHIGFAYWYGAGQYSETVIDYNRGIQRYNFHIRERRKPEFPFSNIQNVNQKGHDTNDGSRRCIRLLKNLKADSDHEIDLSGIQLTTIVHSIENHKLQYFAGWDWKIALAVLRELNALIEVPAYRRQVRSPNGREYPLADDKTVPELIKLKADLDELIIDTAKDLRGQVKNRAILSY